MQTIHFRGTTTENDALTLPSGFLSVDTEKKAVRIHDGETPGGYEKVGTQVYEPPEGPGPTTFLHGNWSLGYFGEMSLYNTDSLASDIGLSAGDASDGDHLWFKFAYEGDIFYIYSQLARNGLSHQDIESTEGQTVTIDDRDFTNVFISEAEWEAMMWRMYADYPNQVDGGEAWNDYASGELTATGGQWTHVRDSSGYVVGSTGGFASNQFDSNADGGSLGWRPVLKIAGGDN